MPYVNVKISGDPIGAEKKRAVIKGITAVLVNELGKNPDYTFVVIEEVPTDNWGWRATSFTEIRKAEAAAKRPLAKRAAARAPAGKATTRKA
jgi:4-oxalocrotonate tautomerase